MQPKAGPVTFDWTDDALGELCRLWADGHSTAEIGRRIGVSKNSVVGKAHRLNLEPRPSPIKVPPRHWTDDEIRKLRAMKIKGMSERIIAKEFGVGKMMVSAKAQELGLEKGVPLLRLKKFRPSQASPKTEPKHVKPVIVAPAPRKIVSFPSAGPSTYKTCQFPSGTPRQADFKFCGKPTVPGKPYCQECCGIAYKPLHDRDQDAAD